MQREQFDAPFISGQRASPEAITINPQQLQQYHVL